MPTPTPPLTSLEAATAESADSLSTIESEAAEYFAARAGEALNPVAPALEKAARAKPALPPTGKTAAAPGSSPAVAAAGTSVSPSADKAAAKVPGAPRLTPGKPGTTKAEAAASTASAPVADERAPDFSDVPREYTPGKTRAPQWDKLHAKADHYEALSVQRHHEAETLRAELEALRAQSSSKPSDEIATRLQTLQAERDALRTQLQSAAGERIFDAESKPRRDAAIAQAKAAAGGDAARIESLLNLPESAYRDEQIEALLSSLPPLRATKLTQAVADLDRLALERAAAAAQGGELWQRRSAEAAAAQERATAERIQAANTTFESELREWEVAGVTPDEASAARAVYTGKGATLQDASRAALWGAVGPRVAAQLHDARTRVAELEGELEKLRGAQPGVGAAASGALPSATEEDDDPSVVGYSDRIAKQALRAGVRFGS